MKSIITVFLILFSTSVVFVNSDEKERVVVGPEAYSVNSSKILERLEKNIGQINTLKADFKQIKHLSVLKHDLVMTGNIYMQKNNQFAWHVLSPMKYSMIMKDDVMKQWDEDTGDENTIALKDKPAFQVAIDQMQLWFAGEYSKLLDVYHLEVRSSTPISLAFTPKNESMKKIIDHVKITFRRDEKYIEEIFIQEKSNGSKKSGIGDSIKINFSNVILNKPIKINAWNVGQRN